jgi:hypothetical protein
MAAQKLTPSKSSSPIFEKLNQDLLKDCKQTAQSARTTVETSKKLTEESRQLLEQTRAKRRRT